MNTSPPDGPFVPRPLDGFGPASWRRPEVVSYGRLPMTATLDRDAVVDLDGDWRFVLLDRPEDVAAEHLDGPTDGWDRIVVPGCWTMQGFDIPQYTNVTMPFPGPPPRVPAENPTGVYRRTAEVPEDWAGRRIVLHVGGAETVLYVHVDGEAVGMGKDSRLPHEFDLSDSVVPGESFELALTVVRWSDATYLEDQDHWHHAGLHRSVRLEATPMVRIDDVHAVADLDPETGAGRLDARVTVGAEGFGPEGWTVRVELDGVSTVAPVASSSADDAEFEALAFNGRVAEASIALDAVRAWSAETPELYDLAATLVDPDGVDVDRAVIAVGFRRVEIVDGELRVNGRPILVKGVNRHDHDARTGKTVTAESIEADIVAMKQHNLNAVRTSHYPNDPHLYDVCDRLGMYVVDEANIETHAHLRSLTRDPRWGPALLERVTRMAIRDKNHPSVIMWSLGNESGSAPIHRAAADWLRGFDPTRPIQYEGALADELFGALGAGVIPEMPDLFAGDHPETDLVAPMYPEIGDIVGWAERPDRPAKPLVMCEYIHAMGNSCGGLDDYWAAIRAHPGLQGGFAWDWVDQALIQEQPDGSERLAYGGDFGDEPNDGPFCCNGLVAADRTPHPSLLEMKAVVAPVRIAGVEDGPGRFSVTNEHAFVDLSWLTAHWTVEIDGAAVATGDLGVVDVDPGATVEVDLPAEALHGDTDEGLVALTLAFVTRTDLPWARAGHEVAWGQSVLAGSDQRIEAPIVAGDRAGSGTTERFDALEPSLSLWRAPIDNETFGPIIGQRHADRWREMGLPDAADEVGMATEIDDGDDSDGLSVTHVAVLPDEFTDIPRVGVRLHVGAGVDRVEWLGDGPHECYSDRKASARLGRWSLSVDDWAVPYVHPSASGNRTGVRWLRLLDGDGIALLTVDRMDGLDVTVSRWTDEQLHAVDHLEELPGSDDCWLWIDAAHRGVGSAAVGPDVPPAHQVNPGTHTWSYRLR